MPSSVNPAQKKVEDGMKQPTAASMPTKASVPPPAPAQKPEAAAADLK